MKKFIIYGHSRQVYFKLIITLLYLGKITFDFH